MTASNYWPVEGDNVTLQCEILDLGNPNSRVFWLSDGKIENKYFNEETIYFANIRKFNKGNYSCGTSNSAGNSSVVSAVIDVLCEFVSRHDTFIFYKLVFLILIHDKN